MSESDSVKNLVKAILMRQKEDRPLRPKATSKPQYEAEPEDKPSSTDAMGHQAFRKGGFSKDEKRAYAKKKFEEDLIQPPKNPPPAWLSDPSLLPKAPPNRKQGE